MAYGAYTKVPLDRTMSEIIALLKKSGAERLAQFENGKQIAVQCFIRDRMLRFAVQLPDNPQGQRQRGRALLLVIKAKLESVESDVETFDEAFLSNIVTPGGANRCRLANPSDRGRLSDWRNADAAAAHGRFGMTTLSPFIHFALTLADGLDAAVDEMPEPACTDARITLSGFARALQIAAERLKAEETAREAKLREAA